MKVTVGYRLYGEIEIDLPDEVNYEDGTIDLLDLEPYEIYELAENEYLRKPLGLIINGIAHDNPNTEIVSVTRIDKNRELWSL